MNPTESRTESTKSTIGLVKDAGGDALQLLKSELALAREELRDNVEEARASALALASAAICGMIGLELVLGAAIAAERRRPMALAGAGMALMAGAAALGATALRAFPSILARTKARAEKDVSRVEESLT